MYFETFWATLASSSQSFARTDSSLTFWYPAEIDGRISYKGNMWPSIIFRYVFDRVFWLPDPSVLHIACEAALCHFGSSSDFLVCEILLARLIVNFYTRLSLRFLLQVSVHSLLPLTVLSYRPSSFMGRWLPSRGPQLLRTFHTR